jgi:hypothetical protein
MQASRLRVLALVAGALLSAWCAGASAEPPSRVARLGYLNGAVSLSPAGESDWLQATVNRPLTTGDRIWVERGARAEIQLGGATLRVSGDSSVAIVNLDDQIAQFHLTQGSMNVSVRRLAAQSTFEVDTPNLAFTLRQSGDYRIGVDADGAATTIFVRKGSGEAYGEDQSYVIAAPRAYRFTGSGLRDYQTVSAPPADDFDRWSATRDRGFDASPSARYVSNDIIGYQDLDANGIWRLDPTYGNVWVPNRVGADWAPYRDGHWAWIDPWGWTWVDDAPWGFAVSHYGRWAHLNNGWGWVPGPPRTSAWYAPALVVFVGGNNFSVALNNARVPGVAWFPLGPREIYHPAYPVSRRYFDNVNRSNTVLNNSQFANAYNRPPATYDAYANRRVAGAIVAVPASTFVESRPVSRAAQRPGRDLPAGAAFAPSLAPTALSVNGAAVQGGRPPGRVFERNLVAHAAPPPGQAGFAAQQKQLQERPGRPLADAQRQALPNRPALVAPVVKLFRSTNGEPASPRSPPPTPAPTTAPQATVTAVPVPVPPARPDRSGGGDEQRRVPTQPTRANAAGVAAPVAPLISLAAPPTPASAQPGREAAARAPVAAPAPPTAPTAVTPAPAAAPVPPRDANAEQRSRGFRQGNRDQGAAAQPPQRPVEPPRPGAAPLQPNPETAAQARPARPQPGAAVAPAPAPVPTPQAQVPPQPSAPPQQRTRPEAAPAAKPAEARQGAAAPAPAQPPQQHQQQQPLRSMPQGEGATRPAAEHPAQAARPQAEPRPPAQDAAKPAAQQPNEKRRGGDENPREDERRKSQ